jgi:hypothetical protein
MRVPAPLAAEAKQALPWLLLLYATASLLHFSHNAEALAAYPNLPASWTRGEVYATWCAITALGAFGYLLYRSGRRLGLALLGVYATLGFAGLLHYTRAPFSHHTAAMNATIWAEAMGGALLLVSVVRLGFRRS